MLYLKHLLTLSTPMLKTRIFIAASLVLPGLFAATTFAGAATLRSEKNPFDALVTKAGQLRTLGQADALINQVKVNCDELEVPDTKGCPTEIKDMKAALKTARGIRGAAAVRAATTDFKESLGEKIERISEFWEENYGGESREEATAPTKPEYQFNPTKFADRKERALVNPFPELIAWVDWMDSGSFKPQAIRANAGSGAPMIIALTEKYCKKLELRDTDGCPDELKQLKSMISQKPALKKTRDEIIKTYHNTLEYLGQRYDELYSGDFRSVDIDTPVAVNNASQPFHQIYSWIEWWDASRLYPDAIRAKYGAKLIKEIEVACPTLCEENPRSFCARVVNKSPLESTSLWRQIDTRPVHMQTKSDFIARFKSDVEWMRDYDCSGAAMTDTDLPDPALDLPGDDEIAPEENDLVHLKQI